MNKQQTKKEPAEKVKLTTGKIKEQANISVLLSGEFL